MKVQFDDRVCMQTMLSVELLIKGLLCMRRPSLSFVMRSFMCLIVYEALEGLTGHLKIRVFLLSALSNLRE